MLDRIRERDSGSGAGPPDLDNPIEIHLMLEVQVKVGELVTEDRSAARPLANVSATRDGDIGAGSRNAAHTVFDPRVQPSAARYRSSSLWQLK